MRTPANQIISCPTHQYPQAPKAEVMTRQADLQDMPVMNLEQQMARLEEEEQARRRLEEEHRKANILEERRRLEAASKQATIKRIEDQIEKSGNVQWSEDNELIYKDKAVPLTNKYQLLSDIASPHRTQPPGYAKFRQAVIDAMISLDDIVNPEYKCKTRENVLRPLKTKPFK